MHDIQRSPSRVGGYVVPADLDEALDLLARHGADARVVAGGTDLLVELSRRTRPDVGLMIDLSGIGDADRIEQVVDPEEGPVLRLGPLTTHQQVVASADAWAHARALAQACAEVGSPQLRNRATVVGNVVTASPANDTLSALVALGAMVEVITAHGGAVDKFMGDAVMAVFGSPLSRGLAQEAEAAVCCALAMEQRLVELNAVWREETATVGPDDGFQPLSNGVGLASGAVVAGQIGSPQRLEFTVIGDTVNLASRLEGLTRQLDV